MRRLLPILLTVAACGDDAARTCVDRWLQWGGDHAHAGAACGAGQPMARTVTKVVIDPFAAMETEDAGGDLLIHYQVPLLDGDDVYVMSKGGSYTSCNPRAGECGYERHTQAWLERALRWEGDQLVERWVFTSDWKPEPFLAFEPMFQPAIHGAFMYVPGAGGSVHKVALDTGLAVARIQPFGATLDPDTYVAGAVVAAADGSIYYNALKLDHDNPYGADAGGWLVRVAPDGTVTTRGYQELVQGAPAATDMCRTAFGTSTPRPLPPADVDGQPVLPPEVPCLSQRPGINHAPAIAADGTVYVLSRAHASDRDAFLTAVSPDLSTRWSRSLNRILDDGCGVLLPSTATMSGQPGCRVGARQGVDPATNELPAARVTDSSSSSPVAVPDGVIYGSFTSYNGSRGHLLKLAAATGALVATHDFGWDVTPAIWHHDGDYSVIIKNNTYARDSQGVLLGPFYIEQLSSSFTSEWRYQLTNTQRCVRGPDEVVTCVDDHPNGFEWCINAPAVDRDGTVYGTGEDGNAYAVGQGGVEKARVFMDMALGAAYTPIALDGKGRVYAMNDGALKVLGQ
jgi:outer membrane protein assembly factor BamB